MSQVLVVWLDACSFELVDRWIATGELPHLAELAGRSARWDLDDHGTRRTGLAGEHLASGLDPEAAGRWAAVDFDPDTYEVRQRPRRVPTIYRDLPIRTLAFDTTYFDLRPGSPVVGVNGWGTHDPGGLAEAVPSTLHREIRGRFGAYPAPASIYATPWSDPARCAEVGRTLSDAVDRRAEIAEWLLTERLPEWDLALIGVSEAHSATEALWHGVDPDHPLYRHASAPAAGDGLREVFRRIDALVGRLVRAVPDAQVVVTSLHGMGPNTGEVVTMAGLGDLLAARAGVATPASGTPPWTWSDDGYPVIDDSMRWSDLVRSWSAPDVTSWRDRIPAALVPTAKRAKAFLDRVRGSGEPAGAAMRWMPVTAHRPHWSSMDAFALPSFYDGRIRVNLAGREAHGTVPVERYGALLEELEAALRACTDPATGAPVVAEVERPVAGDPLAADMTQADLVVIWDGIVSGLQHPVLGRFGPYPFRRTGGHTGGPGALLVSRPGLSPGKRDEVRSAFDVVPTVIAMAGGGVRPTSGRPIEELAGPVARP